MIRLIAAIDRRHGLAKHGTLPWRLPEDMRYFAKQTKTNGGNVLSGKATFLTYKGPLPERQNYVLTRSTEPIDGVILVHDLVGFLKGFQGNEKDLWVAGGATVFEEIIQAGMADELYLTHIDADFGCDQFFPAYEDRFKLVEESDPHEQNGLCFRFARYEKAG